MERPLQRERFRETHTWERGRKEMKSTGKNAVYVVIRREQGSDQGLSGVIMLYRTRKVRLNAPSSRQNENHIYHTTLQLSIIIYI